MPLRRWQLGAISMIFKPKRLGVVSLPEQTLAADKKSCKRFGPCGIGETAIYLNSFYLDRRFYVPIASVRRVFKRIAMSKGGFTGRGVFAAIPYLVVEYDDGAQKQCNFKREEDVDGFLEYMAMIRPDIPRHSVEAERRLREKAEREAARYLKELTPQAKVSWDELEDAKRMLAQAPDKSLRLARAAKNKRRNDQANPAYKWVALAIVIAGVLALAYGLYTLLSKDTSGIYYTLIGLAGIFFFSGAQVLPTAKNNRRIIDREWESALCGLRDYLEGESFPVPPQYAHPVVLDRMIRILREGRAQSADEALEVLKKDLQELNSSVQVEQEEYDEVVQIKPIFLLCEYK